MDSLVQEIMFFMVTKPVEVHLAEEEQFEVEQKFDNIHDLYEYYTRQFEAIYEMYIKELQKLPKGESEYDDLEYQMFDDIMNVMTLTRNLSEASKDHLTEIIRAKLTST